MEIWNRFCDSVSVFLDDSNYPTWNFIMQHYLRAHGLLKFVDGSYPCKSKCVVGDYGLLSASDPDAERWLEQDSCAISVITSRLSPDALTLVVGCQTSMEVWHSLKKKYAIVSESHIMQLKYAIQNIKKGSESVQRYLLKFKSIRDKLAVAGVTLNDHDAISLIIAGLSSEYSPTRMIIRAKNDIGMEEVRSLLLSAEHEIDLKHRVLPFPSQTTMIAHNEISTKNVFITPYGLPSGTTQLNAKCGPNAVPVSYMDDVMSPASTNYINSSSQTMSMDLLGDRASSTLGGTISQSSYQGATKMSSNGRSSELQHEIQSNPVLNHCATMNKASHVMHATMPQQQVENGGFMVQCDNASGAHLQFSIGHYSEPNGSFTQKYSTSHDGISQSISSGNFSQGTLPQQQRRGISSGNTSSKDGNSNDNYSLFPISISRNEGNNWKPKVGTNLACGALIICQVCEQTGHSSYKCNQRNPQHQGAVPSSTLRCQICKKSGHKTTRCRNILDNAIGNTVIDAYTDKVPVQIDKTMSNIAGDHPHSAAGKGTFITELHMPTSSAISTPTPSFQGTAQYICCKLMLGNPRH